ncbi:MAG: hypothetical protein HYU03_07370 [Thaumarchaeota archaeon]|nr:hypothetical protein [Nitrososphaerota archaeon]
MFAGGLGGALKVKFTHYMLATGSQELEAGSGRSSSLASGYTAKGFYWYSHGLV